MFIDVMDLFLFLFLSEGILMMLLEVMVLEIFCVVIDVGGNVEII